jgi:hypothetical protein
MVEITRVLYVLAPQQQQQHNNNNNNNNNNNRRQYSPVYRMKEPKLRI